MLPGTPNYESQKQLLAEGRTFVTNAQQSSRVNTELRSADMDSGADRRIAGLNKWLEVQNPGAGLKVETMPGRAEPDTNKILGKPYESYDAEGTMKKYLGAHPDIVDKLAAAEKAWTDDPGKKKDFSNRNHFSAHRSALQAEAGCNC